MQSCRCILIRGNVLVQSGQTEVWVCRRFISQLPQSQILTHSLTLVVVCLHEAVIHTRRNAHRSIINLDSEGGQEEYHPNPVNYYILSTAYHQDISQLQ